MNRPRFHVLLLEDSPWDADAAARALDASSAGSFDVEHVETLASAQAAARAGTFDAVIMDLNVPDSAGKATLQRIRAALGNVPLIVLTGSYRGSSGADLIDEGAEDYVSKNALDQKDLGQIVRYAVGRARASAGKEVLARELRAVLDAAPEPIGVLDPGGRIVRWNPAYATLVGRSAEELAGRSLFDDVRPEDVPRVRTAIETAIEKGGRVDATMEILSKGGESIPMAWSGSVLRDEAGAIVGVVGVGRDLRPARAEEEQRRKLLEADAEATRLKAAEILRSRFFNLMAHEVNNPLTILVMQIDLLKNEMSEGMSAEQKRSIDVLDRSTESLRGLTRDLLDVARLQSGDLKLRRLDVDLRTLATAVVGSYGVLAGKKGIRLHVDGDASVPVLGDPRRLEQLLVNYVTNALKFTPEGGDIAVDVRLEGGSAILRVRDTGAGLTPPQMASLFVPFSQARDDDASKGTGLGLYISKGIATAHGGTVGCESEGLDRGSTFWLKLPIRDPT